jgi:hypothetical protein
VLAEIRLPQERSCDELDASLDPLIIETNWHQTPAPATITTAGQEVNNVVELASTCFATAWSRSQLVFPVIDVYPQLGVPIWEASGFLGMSAEVLQQVYGHHHPDHLQGAAAAIGQKGRFVSVVESVVDSGVANDQKKKPND